MWDMCGFIARHRLDDEPPSGFDTLAWCARTAGDTVTLLGREAFVPVVLHAPKPVVETLPDYMHGELKRMQAQQLYDTQAIKVHGNDIAALAVAIEKGDAQADPAAANIKLARMIRVRVGRDDLRRTTSILADAPSLAGRKAKCDFKKYVPKGREAIYAPVISDARAASGKTTKRIKELVASGDHKKLCALVNGAGKISSNSHDAQARQVAGLRFLAQHGEVLPLILVSACMHDDIPMFRSVYQAAGLAPFRQAKLTRGVNARNVSALHMACLINEPALIRLLLLQGADVNRADDRGYTPLHYAVQMNSLEVIRLLLQANADPTLKMQGKDPAELAATLQFMAAFTELASTSYWQRRPGNQM